MDLWVECSAYIEIIDFEIQQTVNTMITNCSEVRKTAAPTTTNIALGAVIGALVAVQVATWIVFCVVVIRIKCSTVSQQR